MARRGDHLGAHTTARCCDRAPLLQPLTLMVVAPSASPGAAPAGTLLDVPRRWLHHHFSAQGQAEGSNPSPDSRQLVVLKHLNLDFPSRPRNLARRLLLDLTPRHITPSDASADQPRRRAPVRLRGAGLMASSRPGQMKRGPCPSRPAARTRCADESQVAAVSSHSWR